MDKENIVKKLKDDFAEFTSVFKTAKGVDIAKNAIKTITGKAICGLVALIVLICIFGGGGGKSPSESDFAFELNESGDGLIVSLKMQDAYKKGITKIVVPEKHDGLPVVEISYVTDLTYKKQVTKLELPKTMKKVNRSAISDIPIKDFTMKKGVEYEENSVHTLEQLENLVIEDGVEVIPEKMFFYCTSLKKVKIPASVKTIEPEAFRYCSELVDVEFASEDTKLEDDIFPPFMECPKLSVKSQQEIKKRLQAKN